MQKFTATFAAAENVKWSVSGGDPVSGPGTIDAAGEYLPPSYLTADQRSVVVTATGASGLSASAKLTVRPGFMQPLTPENLTVGANGQTTITGYLGEAGGDTGIEFRLASSPDGQGAGQGMLSNASCVRNDRSFTTCRVVFTAPSAVPATTAVYVVATAGSSGSKTAAEVLLSSAGISSNPATHQAQMGGQILLGSSGGNNENYDASGNLVVDCCSGTLGALVQDSSGRKYLLSNNHVLAQSDRASVGDAIVQPGLIDNNCTPLSEGAGTTAVAALSRWLPLNSLHTNADAAIAQVLSPAVDATGKILELGNRLPDGTLGAAAPGISSSGGKGEPARLRMMVAKSGRTTGLTCATVTAVDVDLSVDYFADCAETKAYLTKRFTGQMAISGNAFSDAGDSGSLVVDAANAEPVGLYFAGGTDADGVSHAMANPAPEILNEFNSQPGGASYSFVGESDHAVSCLNYGDNSARRSLDRRIAESETAKAQVALTTARSLVNPAEGILGVAAGRSSDAPGEGAVLIYVNKGAGPLVPQTLGEVRTVVIQATANEVAAGLAPVGNRGLESSPLTAAALSAAIEAKRQVAHRLMQNPAFFAVGVGQSFDNPGEAVLVIYVDRRYVPNDLPRTVQGLRTRYVVMSRLHVTQSYAAKTPSRPLCSPALARQRW